MTKGLDYKLITALRLIHQDLMNNKISSLEHVRKAQAICDDMIVKHHKREEILPKEVYDMVWDILKFEP